MKTGYVIVEHFLTAQQGQTCKESGNLYIEEKQITEDS